MTAWTLDHHGPAESPVLAAWRAWRHHDELDAELIAGADPHVSPALSRRARRLASVSLRHNLACDLDAIVAATDAHPPSPRALDLRIAEVRAARPALGALADRLRSAAPCHPAGVALCGRLLRDPGSPLYDPAPNDELSRTARAALRALGQAMSV
jgi:hypothetical protein